MAIGSNPFEDAARRDAWERGYREAVLDVYVFLTANDQANHLDPSHFLLIDTMIDQVNDHERGRLNAVVIG